jgi:hypothetical protein
MRNMTSTVSVVASSVCWLLWPQVTRAQPLPADDGLRPRAFVGAAVTLTSSDLGARMRLAGDTSPRGWFVQAGLPVIGRFGVGIEFGGPADATGETRTIGFVSRGRQRERLLIGAGRVRVRGSSRWGVDVIGGAGALFQHHEAVSASCTTCEPYRRDSVDHRAPAFVVGADVPFRLGGPLWIGAVLRYQALARGSHHSQIPALVLPWQYEWKSSRRFSVGIDLRIGR